MGGGRGGGLETGGGRGGTGVLREREGPGDRVGVEGLQRERAQVIATRPLPINP